MTLKDINEILEQTGVPVAYDHFNAVKDVPYIIYRVISSENFCADDRVYAQNLTINILLYTQTKNIELEENIKSLLTQNDITYDQTLETFYGEENVYEVTYQVNIMSYTDLINMSV